VIEGHNSHYADKLSGHVMDQAADLDIRGRSDMEQSPRAAANLKLVLALIVAGEAIISLNFSVLAVAMPSIGSVFHLTPSQLQWVISIYALTEAALLVVGARMSDRHGEKPIYIVGCALSTAGTLASTFAPSLPLLIVARIVQAMGTATLLPATLSLLGRSFPDGRARLRAYAIVLLGQTIISPIGMVTAGWLIGLFGWRSAFAIAVPADIFALVGAAFILPTTTKVKWSLAGFDPLSVILISAAAAFTIWSLSTFAAKGLLAFPSALLPLVAGAIAIIFLAARERRSVEPFFPERLMHGLNFIPALVIQALFQASVTGALVLTNILLQHGLGFTPLQNGMSMIPYAAWSVVAMLAVRWATPLIVRNLRLGISLGYLIVAVGMLLLSVGKNTDFVSEDLPGLLIIATGMMIGYSASTSEVYRSVPPDCRGLAAALVYMARMLFQSMCMALMVSSVHANLSGEKSAIPADSFAMGYRIGAFICVLGVIITVATLKSHNSFTPNREH